jgi:branched-chain amino acid transport system permease protein
MLFVGGCGRTYGPLIGALIYVALPELISGISSVEGIVFDVLLLVTIVLLPSGLIGGMDMVSAWVGSRFSRWKSITTGASELDERGASDDIRAGVNSGDQK